MARRQVNRRVWTATNGNFSTSKRELAMEVPFEIQLRAGREQRSVANIMRTPGNDYELAAGLLYVEDYIHSHHDFSHMTYCMADGAQQEYNLLTVALRAAHLPAPREPEQVVVNGTACGVSSQTLLEALEARARPALSDEGALSPRLLRAAAERVANERSAGLEAAALFDTDGAVVAVREDVHLANALDKLVGWGLLNERLPFARHLMLLTGRVTFALLQRCVLGGATMVGAPGTPSSLAVSLALRQGITLVGLEGVDVIMYAGRERLLPEE